MPHQDVRALPARPSEMTGREQVSRSRTTLGLTLGAVTSRPRIVPYSQQWPAAFEATARKIRAALGPAALRIDHIGSTAVPGLAAKNVIDIQVAVADLSDADPLAPAGFRAYDEGFTDHRPPRDDSPDSEWGKRLFGEPPDERRANIHVRVLGAANQRYALLFRDYLRAHPATADAYAELKRRLAEHMPDTLTYADVKDPAVDLIALAAEDWAVANGWEPGPSDA
jgi:GrpB-like predicted nucleotidyltransferase (UPF0157 family)